MLGVFRTTGDVLPNNRRFLVSALFSRRFTRFRCPRRRSLFLRQTHRYAHRQQRQRTYHRQPLLEPLFHFHHFPSLPLHFFVFADLYGILHNIIILLPHLYVNLQDVQLFFHSYVKSSDKRFPQKNETVGYLINSGQFHASIKSLYLAGLVEEDTMPYVNGMVTSHKSNPSLQVLS